MNLSLFDNMVGPRQGRVTTIRVEFNMAAAIPQWPPVLCVRQQASASRLWTVRDGHTASLTVRVVACAVTQVPRVPVSDAWHGVLYLRWHRAVLPVVPQATATAQVVPPRPHAVVTAV